MCVASLRKQAEHLVTSGTDVMFLMDVRLQSTAEKLIMEARDKAVEAVKLRWAEDKWRYPAFHYEEEALLWKEGAWRTLNSSERAQLPRAHAQRLRKACVR